jgi:hypothetical protein
MQADNIALNKWSYKRDRVKHWFLRDNGRQGGDNLTCQRGNFSNNSICIFLRDNNLDFTAVSTSSGKLSFKSGFLRLDSEGTDVSFGSGVRVDLYYIAFSINFPSLYIYVSVLTPLETVVSWLLTATRSVIQS